MSEGEGAAMPGGWCFDDDGKALRSRGEGPGSEGGFAWRYFERGAEADAWMREHGFADELWTETLSSDEPRPSFTITGEELLLALRTGADDGWREDVTLVPVVVQARYGLVATVRYGSSSWLEHLEQNPTAQGPVRDAGTLLSLIVEHCLDGVEALVEDLNQRMDLLEERLIERPGRSIVGELGTLRRSALHLHRRLTPEREALHRLAIEAPSWVAGEARDRLQEAARQGDRIVDDIQTLRDHAGLVQEEVNARENERLNRRLYLFTVIASIFLPLTFFTGLLGANVEGIPFAGEPWAFAAVIGLSVAIATVQYLFIRWLRLL